MPTKEELEQENAELRAQAERADKAGDGTVLSLEEQGRVLQDLAARQRADAGRLPDPRLDEADEGYHFVVNDQKVDANGQPIRARRD